MTKGGGDGRLAEVQVEPPIHLVILSHGLAGRPADLAYLAEQLRAQVGGSNLHILPSKCNWRKTTDGIAKGGHRLASEIREVVEAHPSLKFISMVGNSLGGCYVRFAAHLLLDENGLMAGLHPHSLITIASPHLGVRNYTWIPLPHWFTQSLAPLIFGQTGRDMFLCDDEEKPLVARMAHEPEFLAAMKAFKQRRLYANLHGDFMVPLGTASIAPNARQLRQRFHAASGEKLNIFQRIFGASRGAIMRVDHSPNLIKEIVDYAPPKKCDAETRMAASINECCSFDRVLIDFGGLLPANHNVICAHSGNALRKLTCRAGRPVMDELATAILQFDIESIDDTAGTTPQNG